MDRGNRAEVDSSAGRGRTGRRARRGAAVLGTAFVLFCTVNAATAVATTPPPPPPTSAGPGGNLSVAVNHTNYATVTNHSFTLSIDTGSSVHNTNEAYASSSCVGCATRAVAFQVVLIYGSPTVVEPVNASYAYNYNCTGCTTQSLAVQLDLSVSGLPTHQEVKDLSAEWNTVERFGAQLNGLTLSQIQAQLTTYEEQILSILKTDSGSTPTPVQPTYVTNTPA